MNKTLIEIADEAADSIWCCCGEKKQKGQSFCFWCYRLLPGRLQSQLYMNGRSFAEGYDESKDWLRLNTKRLKSSGRN